MDNFVIISGKSVIFGIVFQCTYFCHFLEANRFDLPQSFTLIYSIILTFLKKVSRASAFNKYIEIIHSFSM